MSNAHMKREMDWIASLSRGQKALDEVNQRRADDWALASVGYQATRGQRSDPRRTYRVVSKPVPLMENQRWRCDCGALVVGRDMLCKCGRSRD